MAKSVLCTVEGSIGMLIFNKPENRNAMDETFFADLEQGYSALEDDPQVRVILMKSTHPKVFLAGADIAYMVNNSPAKAKAFCDLGSRIFNRMERGTKPIIAVINGHCLGGGLELALSCDIRIATVNAKLGFPEVKLGILPGWGGIHRFARLVGEARAKELFYTGRLLTAQEAFQLGLVNRAVESDQLDACVAEMAAQIQGSAPIPLRLIKQWLPSIMQSADATAGMLASAAMVDCFASQDQKEGMQAFLEKRSPQFQGK